MRYVTTFLFLFFSFIHLEANNIQVIKNGPIHEAYVTQEFGDIILQAVVDKPPPPITEQMPQSFDEKSIWIPGYWAWSRDVGDYIWVSGVWRRSPPEHQWISGHWKNYPQGWVWMRGFWSKVSESELEFIPQPPPDALDEKAPIPPRPEDAYFWAPGYWEWDSNAQDFRWLSGRWDILGEHWLYVPAQYYWREEGYLFVPGYWDRPIEDRGIAFADVSISLEDRKYVVYEPSVILNPLMIMETLYPQWPNYPSLFRYHFYYHYNIWISWGATPPWWQWYSWWCFPVQDAWWLWWWWSHPGYPNPFWLDSAIAQMIKPPSDFVVNMMKKVNPPEIVTEKGVVGSNELIDAIEKVTGKKNPILPSDPKRVKQIQGLANPKTPKPPYLKPTGTGKVDKMPSRPSTGSSSVDTKMAPGRVKLPPHPMEEKKLIVPEKQPPVTPPMSPMKPVPQIQPSTPTSFSPFRPPASPPSPPVQGYQPNYQYPQTQMHTQHLDSLMTEPQPQENPAGPKAHQLPGDES